MNATTARSSKSLTAWTLGALVAAMAVGIYGYESGSPLVSALSRAVQPLGALWLNALQMTVIPLVLTQILAAVVGRGGASAVASIGARAIALFLFLLFVSGMIAAFVAPPIIGLYRVPPDIVASIRTSVVVPATAQEAAAATPGSAWDWVAGLVPTNIFAAAAEGHILPLLVGAVFFALAVTRLPADARAQLGGLFAVLADAMLVLIRWILWGTPVGVFALVSGIALATGGRMVGVLSAYVLASVAVILVLTALMYPLAALFGRTTIVDFARAAAPAQLIGLSTRSSLAALPAQIDSGRRYLKYSDFTSGFTVPLCVTTFKVTTPVSAVAKAFFIAHIFGITIGPAQVVAFVGAMVLISFSTLGVPRGGVPLRGLPAYIAIGLPIEGYILVEAVDDLVDFAQTLNNVTGHAATATLLSRADRARAKVPLAAPAPVPDPIPEVPA
ncbi:MAG: dicarboxylate/amino acid:cation symporter [Longimicrobiales bacterium]